MRAPFALALVVVMRPGAAGADPMRPTPQTNRAGEDWSVLADPARRTEPLDSLKYISLSDNPKTYLSLGLTLRERAESTSAPLFGVANHTADALELQRVQIHADLHLDAHWNVFVQLEDVRAFGKAAIGPSDENQVDFRQAFVMYQHPLGAGVFKARVGRQGFLFDVQRFISLRDGPNVQQAFDAVWAAWDLPTWKIWAFASMPVEYKHGRVFDDWHSFDDRLSIVRLERKLGGGVAASAYYGRYDRPSVKYVDAEGEEKRDIVDVRFVGAGRGIDWDAEGMVQGGHIANKTIRAWATGARLGYTIHPPLSTRIGVQVDTASGDRHAGDDSVQTFTPLFPNGYYFTLASDTGYANLIHVRPSVTQKLTRDVTAMATWGFQWRETTSDAIYLHPMTPLPMTAGHGDAWTGSYVQIRGEAKFGPRVLVSAELVHYQAGAAIRAAGGGNTDYAAVETKLSF
ncbi:MAG TPA: alginate export family protein [Kofleriaceae bacterium]|jgi:hypothetical protein